MKHLIGITLIIFLTGLAGQIQAQQIAQLIPASGAVPGWEPTGAAEHAIGEDLYLMINGGAEIFYEYGFESAVYQTYGSLTGAIINIEIYEMVDTTAAYGIYTFKTGTNGRPAPFGCQATFAAYYLNFWAGRFQVTVVGMDTSTEIIDGIHAFGSYISGRLGCRHRPPELIHCLPADGRLFNGVKYIRGNLGLFNQYVFDRKDIFAVQEGVIGHYQNYLLLVFQYADAAESEMWFRRASAHLLDSPLFSEGSEGPGYFTITDVNGRKLLARRHQKWILVAAGDPEVETAGLLGEVAENLDNIRFPSRTP